VILNCDWSRDDTLHPHRPIPLRPSSGGSSDGIGGGERRVITRRNHGSELPAGSADAARSGRGACRCQPLAAKRKDRHLPGGRPVRPYRSHSSFDWIHCRWRTDAGGHPDSGTLVVLTGPCSSSGRNSLTPGGSSRFRPECFPGPDRGVRRESACHTHFQLGSSSAAA
jgi:hypothetical protein